jgi:dolichol-phosphate mannosyltransferase
MKTLIIIPTYNELENLPPLLKEIFSYAPTTDLLIIDDNSPDGTGALADRISKEDPRLHVLHRAGKLGLGTAYIAGFKYAIAHGYDAVFEMDADFSHNPLYLPDFLKKIQQADLVIGSRYIKGGSTPNWSVSRRLISGCGNIFARIVLGMPVHDCTAGYRCYRRTVLERIGLDTIQSQGYGFQVEMAYRVQTLGFKIAETPIVFMDRRVGQSKMSRKIVFEAFSYVLRARFSKPSFTAPLNVPHPSQPAAVPNVSSYTSPLPHPLSSSSPYPLADPLPSLSSQPSLYPLADPLPDLFSQPLSDPLADPLPNLLFNEQLSMEENRSRLKTARVRLLPFGTGAYPRLSSVQISENEQAPNSLASSPKF